MKPENPNLAKLIWGTAVFSIFFIILGAGILIFLPEEQNQKIEQIVAVKHEEVEEQKEEVVFDLEELSELVMDLSEKEDVGLVYYRDPQSKSAVEWFYSRLVKDRNIARAILTNADKYDISLSLAFALAHTESRYNTTAVHKNKNGTVDRGLFQLNNNSFPGLCESDFYNPEISAKYGLSHLQFCISTAGNEIAALAMYNAGTNKVRNNGTPQVTLNYINQIENYRSAIEENFKTEVIALFNSGNAVEDSKLLAKK